MENNVVLTMRGITMTFPGVKALDHVDFTLRKGEIHALMGENGAGKSTLIKCLTGVNDFEAGEIRVEGIEGPVRNHSTLEAQKRGISTVYQEVNLCPNLSVAENLFIGREPMTKMHTINRKAMISRARQLMEQLNLPVDVTRDLEEYSLAMQQMIAIARAVDMDCKVLILDDSTSAVDTATDAKIRAAFRESIPGTTKIIIAQRISSVQDADRILVLDDGKIDAFDSHENLLKSNAIYQEIYESQIKGGGDFDQPN